MLTTQHLLVLLTGFWALQVAASWIQYRHYRRALAEATHRWSDGYLGVGQSRRLLRGGAVALLEVDPALRVRRLQLLGGISILARFETRPAAEGLTLTELAAHMHEAGRPVQALATAQAIAQVQSVAAQRAPTTRVPRAA